MGDAHRWTEMHGVAAQERDYVAFAMRILDATDGDEAAVWLEELKRSGCMRGQFGQLGLELRERLAGRGLPRVCFGAVVSGPIVGC